MNPDPRFKRALAEPVQQTSCLLRCVIFLAKNDVQVIEVSGKPGRGHAGLRVRVAASPVLRRLLPECYWRKRSQHGPHAIDTWSASRFGVRIDWDEKKEVRP